MMGTIIFVFASLVIVMIALPMFLVAVIGVSMVFIEIALVTTYHLRQHKKKGD